MEFGKLNQLDQIETVDFRLPDLDKISMDYLRDLSAPKSSTQYFLGTPAWGHKAWIGKIYPEKTKPADFLKYYAESFNTIELNSSHYGIPNEAVVSKWLSSVPKDFLFCPKLLQQISHYDQGMKDLSLHNMWFQFLESLKENRGPCFAQFPPHFDYSKKALLFQFLEQWPIDFELSLELRHPSWFHNGQILPALTQYLQKKGKAGKGIGLVITDVAGRRDVVHSSISAPFSMLRWIGNDLHPTDFERAKAWASRIAEFSHAGLQRMFFFVHQPEDINAPEMANTIIHELNEECGAELKPLQWCAASFDS